MAKTSVKQKPDGKRSSAVREALTRRDVRNVRFLYEDIIQRHAQHLKECRKSGCLECKDAEALIPYYRVEMKKALRNISILNHKPRLPA